MLTYVQYLNSLERLHITDHNGMAIFLEYRFQITRREAREIVNDWERSHEAVKAVFVDCAFNVLDGAPNSHRDMDRRGGGHGAISHLKTRG